MHYNSLIEDYFEFYKYNPNNFEVLNNKKLEIDVAGNELLETHDLLLIHETLEVVELKEEANETVNTASRLELLLLVITLALSIVLGLFLAHSISIPLVILRDASIKLGQGKLGTRINIKSKDELGDLAVAFNKMSTDLQKSRKELRKVPQKLEKEVKERTKELQKAYKELRVLDKAKTEFTMLASHELKSPLVPIMGYSELMLKGELGKLSKIQKEKIQIMLNNTKSLQDRINEMLDVSKLELHKVDLDLQENNISAISKEVKDEYSPLAKKKNASITVIAPEKIMIKSDKGRIRQVLSNLVGNAIKYNQKGKKNNITITLTEEKKNILIAIKDQGRGVPKQNIGKLFQKFYRVSEAVTTKEGGVGVGLVIAKGLVELHGGTITVTSKLGVGTTFTITLPKKRPLKGRT